MPVGFADVQVWLSAWHLGSLQAWAKNEVRGNLSDTRQHQEHRKHVTRRN